MAKSKRCCSCYSGSCLTNAASAVAIFDLAIVAAPLTYETATVGYYLGMVHLVGHQNDTCYNGDCTWLQEHVEKVSIKSSTSVVVTLILFILMGAVIEGYLFTLIRKGVREEIYKCCKKWSFIRLLLLFLTILGSIGKVLRNNYILSIDGLFDLIKVYRVIALFIVLCFMKELERTVGVIYIEPPMKPKRGSLGRDLYLLD